MNIAEILKNVPEGTQLYSSVYGDVTFLYLDDDYSPTCILCEIPRTREQIGFSLYGLAFGCYTNNNAECVLFPSKENRDWNTFVMDLPKFTVCFCFTERNSNKFIRLYNTKGEVFYDGSITKGSMGWNYIVPCDKYVLATGYFDVKDNYGIMSNKKW